MRMGFESANLWKHFMENPQKINSHSLILKYPTNLPQSDTNLLRAKFYVWSTILGIIFYFFSAPHTFFLEWIFLGFWNFAMSFKSHKKDFLLGMRVITCKRGPIWHATLFLLYFWDVFREGFERKKLIISMEFSMEGYPPPPAPLPWKIINFFPTIFQIFVLWYNRPETHFVWYHTFLAQIWLS